MSKFKEILIEAEGLECLIRTVEDKDYKGEACYQIRKFRDSDRIYIYVPAARLHQLLQDLGIKIPFGDK